MATYTSNYNLKKPDNSDPFGDFRGDYNDNLDIIDANLGGGGGSGGHTIIDPNGTDMTQRTGLQFTGNVSVSDDGVNDKTVVDILGGGSNLILDAEIFSTEEKEVGVWIDQKPLYQKTIVLNSEITVSNTAWTSTGVTANSLDVDKYVRCVAQNNGGTCWDAMNVATIGGYISLTAWRNGDTIGVKTFTIQYTKTTDTAGSGGYQAYGFSPVIYSDVERVIGVWRDNKPLYQKTVYYAGGSSGTISFAHGISDIDEIASAVGIAKDTDVIGDFIPFARIRSDGLNIGISDVTTSNINYYVPSQFGSRIVDVYVTLQYTKTTDVAGSGDYNTYGVPTVHYDTNEQVIGTYLGKPLYQKTFNVASASLSSREYSISTGLSNVKRIIGYSGHLTSGSESYALPYERLTETESIRIMARANADGTVTANLITGVGGSSSYGTVTDICLTLQYTKTTD